MIQEKIKSSLKDFNDFCRSVTKMSDEEIKERLKGTPEEKRLENADALHKSGLLQRIAKKVYEK